MPSLVEIGAVILERMKMWTIYRQTDRQTTNDRWSENLTWAFGSGELKKIAEKAVPCYTLVILGMQTIGSLFEKENVLFFLILGASGCIIYQ